MMKLKPRDAESPYQRLAAAVLKQAYTDYTEALAIVRVMDKPLRNPRTERIYGRYLRRAYGTAKSQRALDPDDRAMKIMDTMYYNAEATIRDVTRFCTGDMFVLYSDSIQGEWFLQAMDKVIDEWIECKRKRYAIKEEK